MQDDHRDQVPTVLRVIAFITVAVLIAVPGPTVGRGVRLEFALVAGLAVVELVVVVRGKVTNRPRSK